MKSNRAESDVVPYIIEWKDIYHWHGELFILFVIEQSISVIIGLIIGGCNLFFWHLAGHSFPLFIEIAFILILIQCILPVCIFYRQLPMNALVDFMTLSFVSEVLFIRFSNSL